MKGLEKAEKGQGLALKLFNSGLKYQQHMKHTLGGIGILSLISQNKLGWTYKVRLDLQS